MSDNEADSIDLLNQTVASLHHRGEYERAFDLANRAQQLARRHLPKSDPRVADCLSNLAALHLADGNHETAEHLSVEALRIRKQSLGENHRDTALSLHNLAAVHELKGDFRSAELFYRDALKVSAATVGECHPEYAGTLNNLSMVCLRLGKLSEARSIAQTAMHIRRSSLGQKSPEFAQSLNNLAEVYRALRDDAVAEALNLRSVEIFEKSVGSHHRDYATALSNLALAYESRSDYADAARHSRTALGILRTLVGENHPEYADGLAILSRLDQRMGRYSEAKALCHQALDIWRRTLGEGHLRFATGMHNLAGVHQDLGENREAESLLRRALAICRDSVGERHPDFVDTEYALAGALAATGRPTQAFELMARAASNEDRTIAEVVGSASERQLMGFLEKAHLALAGLLSLVLQYLPNCLEEVCLAFDLVLRRKAIMFEAAATQREVVLRGRYPSLRSKLEELSSLRMQIAHTTLAGPGPEGRQAYNRILSEYQGRKETLEADLASQIPEFEFCENLQAADRKAVAEHLSDGETLIEFVRFAPFDFEAVPARREPRWKPARYLAFVLPAGRPNDVQMLDLGAAEPIDRMIAHFREEIVREAEQDMPRDMLRRPAGQRSKADPGLGQELRGVVFDKIVRATNGCKRFLIAPDGDLCRLSFEALPIGESRCLIDEYSITYLTCGRDVLRFQKPSTAASQPVVIADPDFDFQVPDQTAADVNEAPSSCLPREYRRADMTFPSLPETRLEAETISSLLGVEPWLDRNAIKGHLKRIRSPRVLHIATHGFFLADEDRDPNKQGSWFATTDLGRMSGLRLDNPLLRSALALAGANSWFQRRRLPTGAENGLLTAEEVTSLDLLDTQLVVLSSCDTGLGEISTGEGVFGLRRAFALAGARTLVMSLWKVPDRPTRELMQDFYLRILDGESCSDALRSAKLAIKARMPAPYYWGAFICEGWSGPISLCIPNAPSGRACEDSACRETEEEHR